MIRLELATESHGDVLQPRAIPANPATLSTTIASLFPSGVAAAVAERARVIALGLDSEVVGAVKADLWPSICAAAELAWVNTLHHGERAKAVAMILSAKEAFYKCQYPLVGEG